MGCTRNGCLKAFLKSLSEGFLHGFDARNYERYPEPRNTKPRTAEFRTSSCRTSYFVLSTSNLVLRTSYCPTSEFAFFRIPDPSASGGALEEDRGTLRAGRGSEGLGRQCPWGPGAQEHRKGAFKSPISGGPPPGGGGGTPSQRRRRRSSNLSTLLDTSERRRGSAGRGATSSYILYSEKVTYLRTHG